MQSGNQSLTSLYNFHLITSPKGIIKLRRSVKGANGKQEVVSLGYKVGTFQDNVPVEEIAQALLTQHKQGTLNFFDTSKTSNRMNPKKDFGNDMVKDVLEQCYREIEANDLLEKRNQ